MSRSICFRGNKGDILILLLLFWGLILVTVIIVLRCFFNGSVCFCCEWNSFILSNNIIVAVVVAAAPYGSFRRSFCNEGRFHCTHLHYKTPFTTNKFGKNGIVSILDLPSLAVKLSNAALALLTPQTGGALRVPYIMVQPMMNNRKEYKVVFFNCCFMHIANINQRRFGEIAWSFGSHSRLVSFALDALTQLKVRRPETITDFLVRVDVFESNEVECFDETNPDFPMDDFRHWRDAEGRYCRFKLVVNEFESIEANFPGKNHEEVKTLIYRYWCAHMYRTMFEKVGVKK
jgi:hypothetical protein